MASSSEQDRDEVDTIRSYGLSTLRHRIPTDILTQERKTLSEDMNLRRVLYGLDPLYHAFPKVLNKHVLDIAAHVKQKSLNESISSPTGIARSNPPEFLLLGHRPVTGVEICGIIVSVRIYAKKHTYMIDDGTGILACQCWFNQGSGGAQFDRTSANILVSLCDEAGNPTPLPQGTLVSIQGRLSAWRGSLEISVHHCKILKDPHAQQLHWLRVIDLCERVYAKTSPAFAIALRSIDTSSSLPPSTFTSPDLWLDSSQSAKITSPRCYQALPPLLKQRLATDHTSIETGDSKITESNQDLKASLDCSSGGPRNSSYLEPNVAIGSTNKDSDRKNEEDNERQKRILALSALMDYIDNRLRMSHQCPCLALSNLHQDGNGNPQPTWLNPNSVCARLLVSETNLIEVAAKGLGLSIEAIRAEIDRRIAKRMILYARQQQPQAKSSDSAEALTYAHSLLRLLQSYGVLAPCSRDVQIHSRCTSDVQGAQSGYIILAPLGLSAALVTNELNIAWRETAAVTPILHNSRAASVTTAKLGEVLKRRLTHISESSVSTVIEDTIHTLMVIKMVDCEVSHLANEDQNNKTTFVRLSTKLRDMLTGKSRVKGNHHQ